MGPRRLAAACAGIVLALGGVTACTGSDDPDQPGAADTDPGRPLETMGADGLPADYPRDEAPLVTGGEVTSVEKGKKNDPGYTVSIVVDSTPAETVRTAVGLLEDAGWTSTTEVAGDPPPVQVLTKDGGQVVIVNAESGGQTVLTYAIEL